MDGFLWKLRNRLPRHQGAVGIPQLQAARSRFRVAVGELPPAKPIVGHGLRIPTHSGEPTLVLSVSRDSTWVLADLEPLQDEYEGVPVCVERSTAPTLAVWSWKRGPVAQGGVGIRVDDLDRLGTLGCFVERDGKSFGLTCEHVIAKLDFSIPFGSLVLWKDMRLAQENWAKLGTVAEVGGIDHVTGIAETDSALVSLDCPFAESVVEVGRMHPEPLDEYLAVATRARVIKMGARTERTVGRIQGSFDVGIRVRDAQGQYLKTILYPNVLEVVAEDLALLCGSGDSGSILCAEPDNRGEKPRAVGILCSTALQHRGYAVPMTRVLERHRIKLL